MKKNGKEKGSKLENGKDQINTKAMNAAMQVVKEYRSVKLDTDPLGMWTGNPDDIGEEPEQDADDL